MLPRFDAEDGRCCSSGAREDNLLAELGGDCLETVEFVTVVSIGRHGEVALLDRLLPMTVAPKPTVAAFPIVVTCNVSITPPGALSWIVPFSAFSPVVRRPCCSSEVIIRCCGDESMEVFLSPCTLSLGCDPLVPLSATAAAATITPLSHAVSPGNDGRTMLWSQITIKLLFCSSRSLHCSAAT